MKNLLILLFGITLGGFAIWAVLYLQQNYKVTKNNDIATEYPSVTGSMEVTNTINTPTTALEENVGYVEGTISFPSEGIPKDLSVCAETTGGAIIKCTNTHINDAKYKTGIGYKLELNPGTYYVYATVPSFPNKAYYNEFVTCGLLASCPSHAKIAITVKAGETVTKVDPGDWYNQ